MRTSVFDLAARIAQTSSDFTFNDTTIAQLATLMFRDGGIVRQELHCIVVLDTPFNAGLVDRPVCIIGVLDGSQLTRAVIDESNVTLFIRQRNPEIQSAKPVNYKSGMSFPWLHRWYDLRRVPVGGLAYHLDKAGTLYMFQRLNDSYWGPAIMPPDAWHAVDVARILQELGDGTRVKELVRDPRCIEPVLFRQPPDD